MTDELTKNQFVSPEILPNLELIWTSARIREVYILQICLDCQQLFSWKPTSMYWSTNVKLFNIQIIVCMHACMASFIEKVIRLKTDLVEHEVRPMLFVLGQHSQSPPSFVYFNYYCIFSCIPFRGGASQYLALSVFLFLPVFFQFDI